MFIALLLQEMSIWKHTSFLILAILVIPYFHFFAWMEDNRLFHKQFRNIFHVDKKTMEVTNRLQNTVIHNTDSDLPDVKSDVKS